MSRPTNEELAEKSALREQGLKRCRSCQEVKTLDSFGAYYRGTDGLQASCKQCINFKNVEYDRESRKRDPEGYAARKRREKKDWVEKYPDRYREGYRKNNLRKYGLTAEAFDTLLESQNGKCAICKKELVQGRDLHVDHDHRTGAVRALLCGSCNLGLGHFRDNPEVLRAAATYVEQNL